jgi:hypothetical protein
LLPVPECEPFDIVDSVTGTECAARNGAIAVGFGGSVQVGGAQRASHGVA